MWSDGNTATYTNWATGEPNNAGGEDCAMLHADAVGGAGKWNDAPCEIDEVSSKFCSEPQVRWFCAVWGVG